MACRAYPAQAERGERGHQETPEQLPVRCRDGPDQPGPTDYPKNVGPVPRGAHRWCRQTEWRRRRHGYAQQRVLPASTDPSPPARLARQVKAWGPIDPWKEMKQDGQT